MVRLIIPFLAALGNLFSSAALAGVFDPDINGTGMTMAEYMIPVAGGGQPGGPAYAYRLGKFEITNKQFCDFLNDAELDANSGSPTRRSSNMFFGPDGSVFLDSSMSVWEPIFWPAERQWHSDISYDPDATMGSRYSVIEGPFGPKTTHPARRMSWMGALKFCNWLTIDQGVGESHCCYTEGPDVGDWHPVTISTENWWGKEPAHNDDLSAGRDLNDNERNELVSQYRGYRLPMDDAGLLAPNNRPYPNDFNEWLKAAAYDPDAPDTVRTNAGGWQAMPDHWMYGFGREANTGADANFNDSGDPYDDETTPVDYYDGSDHGGTFPTNDTDNRYGFYAMAGNVWEWCQDYGVAMTHRAVYGGSWVSTPQRQAASSCYKYGKAVMADLSFGIRILRVPGTITVCWDGSGDYITIQDAIDAAADGDEIVVCDGTYTGPGNRELDFSNGLAPGQTRAITVRSENGPDTTIIDCQQAGRAFHFHSGEGPASVVDGFTVINGAAPADFGGGINCNDSSPTITNCRLIANSADGGGGISTSNGGTPTITNCRLTGNSAAGGGAIRCFESTAVIADCTISGNSANSCAGIYCSRNNSTITNCRISGNSAFAGAAIYCYLSDVTITNCIVTGNSVTSSGGGVYFSSSAPMITNCRVAGNFANNAGGGIRCYNSSPTITNCTVSRNATGGDGGGLYAEGDGGPVFTNGILWSNSPQQVYGSATVTYSDVQDGWPGTANIDADPLFAGGPTGSWTSDGDYDPAAHEITFTDSTATWTQGQWVGKTVNPDATQPLQFVILANTANTVTILADWDTIDAGTSWVATGASYQIHDDRLTSASPCINMADTSALPQDTVDLDGDGDTGEPIPFDLDGNPRVRGCLVDMGAYEFQTPTGVDIPADFDDDCDVDSEDLDHLQDCATGPGIPQASPDCLDARLDGDDDVDQEDFGLFQACLSGAGQLPPANCYP